MFVGAFGLLVYIYAFVVNWVCKWFLKHLVFSVFLSMLRVKWEVYDVLAIALHDVLCFYWVIHIRRFRLWVGGLINFYFLFEGNVKFERYTVNIFSNWSIWLVRVAYTEMYLFWNINAISNLEILFVIWNPWRLYT